MKFLTLAAGVKIIQIARGCSEIATSSYDWYEDYLDWAIPASPFGTQQRTRQLQNSHSHAAILEFTDIIPANDILQTLSHLSSAVQT